jgi:methyl-accepting chemotaxis protein
MSIRSFVRDEMRDLNIASTVDSLANNSVRNILGNNLLMNDYIMKAVSKANDAIEDGNRKLKQDLSRTVSEAKSEITATVNNSVNSNLSNIEYTKALEASIWAKVNGHIYTLDTKNKNTMAELSDKLNKLNKMNTTVEEMNTRLNKMHNSQMYNYGINFLIGAGAGLLFGIFVGKK